MIKGSKSWLVAVVLIMALLFTGCSQKQIESAEPSGVPVTVANVEQKTVPLDVQAIATVEPYSTVDIKAQISGQVETVHFREGDYVQKGQLLFTIDQRPFRAALREAEAALARQKAEAANAHAQAARYRKLLQEGVVAAERAEQVQTEAEALSSAVEADEAAVENARLQLAYTTIRAPINGRTGSLMLHEGNLVKANADDPMVVIHQIEPIYVSFSVPEDRLDEIKQHAARESLTVLAKVPGSDEPERGSLTFVDNKVDRQTGTILLKGTFANREKRLWPGQFVNAVLRLSEQKNAIVVPTEAVQTGQEGQYVFVVRPNQTAEMRPIVVERELARETVVRQGLEVGETVVTDGQMRLVPDAPVRIKGGGEGS